MKHFAKIVVAVSYFRKKTPTLYVRQGIKYTSIKSKLYPSLNKVMNIGENKKILTVS